VNQQREVFENSKAFQTEGFSSILKAFLLKYGKKAEHHLNRIPLVRPAKNLRNILVDGMFRIQGRSKGKQLAEEIKKRRWKYVAFSIAFNTPWLIDLLTEAWQKHSCGFDLVIIDNSNNPAARVQNASICQKRNIPYLGLPRNPEWNPNRSHGITLNWIWSNVVPLAALKIAGFIDHDCIPIRSSDILSRMNGLEAYGLRCISTKNPLIWKLWAGYCFFDFSIASKYKLDFKHRVEYGLDTGGGNWLSFYRFLDQKIERDALRGKETIEMNANSESFEAMLIDQAFLHLEGVSYFKKYQNTDFCITLAKKLREKYLS